jgi:hypothetical protein
LSSMWMTWRRRRSPAGWRRMKPTGATSDLYHSQCLAFDTPCPWR